MPHPELAIFFFIIAAVYASAGFGGGSSYLAILSLYAVPFTEMRLIALVCNIIVVGGSTWLFIRHREMSWRKVLPLVILSVPMAFLGARMKISKEAYFAVLGCCLIQTAVLLWIRTNKMKENRPSAIGNNIIVNGLTGGAIGFLSGMVGIGGGIFLAPLLHLGRWDTPRRIAATASFFILVNSVAGIAGQFGQHAAPLNLRMLLMLGAAVLIGGQIGSRMGSLKASPLVIRRLTAGLVFTAGVEVLLRQAHLFK